GVAERGELLTLAVQALLVAAAPAAAVDQQHRRATRRDTRGPEGVERQVLPADRAPEYVVRAAYRRGTRSGGCDGWTHGRGQPSHTDHGHRDGDAGSVQEAGGGPQSSTGAVLSGGDTGAARRAPRRTETTRIPATATGRNHHGLCCPLTS